MKVLSIDFDIIMSPSIEGYNNMVKTQSSENINSFIKRCPILNYIDCDTYTYQQIVLYILNLANKVPQENIMIAHDHGKIEQLLQGETDLYVLNIDHHHDITYRDNETFETCSCSNWVGYLNDKKRLHSYVWVHNNNSSLPIDQISRAIPNYHDFNISKIQNLHNLFYNPDKIFVCLSPEWVPEKYYPLFYLLLDLLNQNNNYHLDFID